ncbi:UNVERIFIED_CONTAM: hypothetical protein NCL1_48767 [Trichonephila clavipes]
MAAPFRSRSLGYRSFSYHMKKIYQRCLQANNSMNHNIPSMYPEIRNFSFASRYDCFSRGCYVPPHWLLSNLAKPNCESFYLVKKNEQYAFLKNYYGNRHMSKENEYHHGRWNNGRNKLNCKQEMEHCDTVNVLLYDHICFDIQDYIKANMKDNDRNAASDAFSQSGRRYFMNWNSISSFNRFKESSDDSRVPRRSSRYVKNEPEKTIGPFQRYSEERLNSTESLIGKVKKTCIENLSGSQSSSSLPPIEDCEGTLEDINISSTNNLNSQLSESSIHTPSPELNSGYASW